MLSSPFPCVEPVLGERSKEWSHSVDLNLELFRLLDISIVARYTPYLLSHLHHSADECIPVP